ncbi:DNA mismatch repair protein MutS [uncultured Brachyspira sp.]|uniref:DNA mismatch repair protein MutS n=1 Tax=uncultured Brachyspira sp. TaxID=221953 RepID=UPI0025D71577|nr:DNA mismatch repair protein MutS [uncultured Brachyspira sp.]
MQETFFGSGKEETQKLTPMMRQYKEIKDKYNDSILLFRMGDFYEVFFDDAKIVSDILGLTLTKRANVPMAGVPYHAIDNYLSKLVKSGMKIAVCDQMEDPKFAKGIVRREVTQVITPGIISENKYLESKSNNYLASVIVSKSEKNAALSICDISTGELYAAEINTNLDNQNKAVKEIIDGLTEEIIRFSPKEIMAIESVSESIIIKEIKNKFSNIFYSTSANYTAEYSYAYKTLTNHFKTVSLKSFGIEEKPLLISLLGSTIFYIQELSKTSLKHISDIKLYNKADSMTLDYATIASLEILETIRNDNNKMTLFDTIDRTKTSMGARYLKRIIVKPLLNIDDINKRLDNVEFFYKNQKLMYKIRDLLQDIGDIERLASKLALSRINPKELVSLKKFLVISLEVITELAMNNFEEVNFEEVNDIKIITDLIERAILEEPKIVINEGDIIKDDYDETLKKYNEARRKGRSWISELEYNYKSDTGINNLKIRYNNVIGYYIEVTKANASSVPVNFIKRQTLIGSERYTTDKLMEYETIINDANEKSYSLEYDIFIEVRNKANEYLNSILKTAKIISVIDVYSSLAFLAKEDNYIRPVITNDGIIDIKEGRHPVVEVNLKTESFIPNDTYLDNKNEHLLIITGPNMSGKSTYLRQTALIVLLAQIGSFVPASGAKISVVDRIFTRVGASDNIARGESTFLVEMNETAYILNHCTDKSLVIMDEIGRGTSTYDGLSIAWAIVEYLAHEENKRSKTLFATHYHELTMLEDLEGVKNYRVLVEEYKDEIIFMKKVTEGAAKSSYGIYAAKIAGAPNKVIKRASEILKKLETEAGVQAENIELNTQKSVGMLPFYDDKKIKETIIKERESEIEKEIKELNISIITPIDAINLINKWKNMI